jgi:hypothetical protein
MTDPAWVIVRTLSQAEEVAERSPHKRQIDIEYLLHWAFEQTGILPWRGVSERALMYDHGYSVIPKGCATSYSGGETLLRCDVPEDAAIIIHAVGALPLEVRSVVKACALQQIRPNWMEGVEPRLVERKISWRKRKKRGSRGHRSHVQRLWEPCSPETICAVRHIYTAWHAALATLLSRLDGRLSAYHINGLAAPPAPWEQRGEKSACNEPKAS